MKASEPPKIFAPACALNPREVYERNPDFTGQEEQFRLRPYEWEFYLRLDGCRTVMEICEARKLTVEWVIPMLERLQGLGLIRVVEISMAEFYRRFVDVPAAEPAPRAAPAGENAPVPAADAKRVSFSLRNKAAAPVTPAAPPPPPVPASRPALATAAMPVPALAAAGEELPLKPLLDFVIGHSGGGTVGQLAAYRVFLKVPNDLLRQAGIRSLNLVREDFTIRDPALKRALLTAVEDVLGRAYVPATAARAPVAPGVHATVVPAAFAA